MRVHRPLVAVSLAMHHLRGQPLKFSGGYKSYVLGMLTLVFTFNYLDRNLIVLLLQPIKDDLRISDTKLGFLTGIAFGLFYATLGLPIARWADRGNRVSLTSMAIGLWSLTVMSCLWIGTFTQLVFARVAAAVGEAGCMPPTYSLLADYYPRSAERTRAMAIYWLANPLSALFSYVVGGQLNARYGWRVTFFLMGLPALIVAPLVKFTVHEPRTLTTGVAAVARPVPRLAEVLGTLWRQRSSRNLTVGIVLLYTMALGLSPWYAAFMMRTHGMGTSELGVWLGLIFSTGGTVGIFFGSYASTRWFSGDERGQLWLSSGMIASLAIFYVMFLLLPQKLLALLALIPLAVVASVFLGPTFALMQRLVADEMRATALAVVMLLANLIGMGVGPQVVGILSDLLEPVFLRDSLRYAMLVMSFVSLWAAYHFWKAGRTVREDLEIAATDVWSKESERAAKASVGIG